MNKNEMIRHISLEAAKAWVNYCNARINHNERAEKLRDDWYVLNKLCKELHIDYSDYHDLRNVIRNGESILEWHVIER